jgi:hypothetical protein
MGGEIIEQGTRDRRLADPTLVGTDQYHSWLCHTAPHPRKHLLPNIRRAAVQKNGGMGAKMWNLFASAKDGMRNQQADAQFYSPAYRFIYLCTVRTAQSPFTLLSGLRP